MKQRKTDIIATIGPATLDQKVFAKTIHEGVDIIRINSAYGSFHQYDQILDNLRAISKKHVKVMLDIKDTKVLQYYLDNNLDMIAISFCESREQVEQVRVICPGSFIISKIESKKGVTNFDEILEVSDGVMIARGDLGEAVMNEKVPCLQKNFTKKTVKAKKYLVAATEMLLSMVDHIDPTRAEVSDVANAVFDGASAVMLSEETAIGKHPAEAVAYMRKIIEEAENCEC